MVNFVLIVVVTFFITFVGGGLFWLIWVLTRPKKMTWKAKVYQLGEGIRPPIIDKRGNLTSDTKIGDLRPYTRDVIEKIFKEPGITIFRLIKLNKVVDGIPSDSVDYWGEKDKEVNVLLEGDTCTVMRKGYDKDAGIIFEPLPHDKINMMKGEISIRKDRLRKEKDILTAITPWIVAGIAIFGLIAIFYLAIQGMVEISENNNEAARYLGDKIATSTSQFKSLTTGELPDIGGSLGVQETPPEITP